MNTTVVRQEKEITNEMHILDKNLAALSEMIGELAVEIVPVMSNTEMSEEGELAETKSCLSSALALELREYNDKAEGMLSRVRSLVERVEL